MTLVTLSLTSFASDPLLVCENDQDFYRDSSFYNGESGLAFWSSQNVNVIIFAKIQSNKYSLKINVLNFSTGERIELLRTIDPAGTVKIPTPENIICSIRD